MTIPVEEREERAVLRGLKADEKLLMLMDWRSWKGQVKGLKKRG